MTDYVEDRLRKLLRGGLHPDIYAALSEAEDELRRLRDVHVAFDRSTRANLAANIAGGLVVNATGAGDINSEAYREIVNQCAQVACDMADAILNKLGVKP